MLAAARSHDDNPVTLKNYGLPPGGGGHPIGTIILLVIYLLAIIVAALVEQHKFGETSVATKLLVTGGAIGVLLFTVRTCNVSI